MIDMQGIILAGGHGTRLRPTTKVVNKHFFQIFDKPLIFYPIETLREAGVTDIILTVGTDDQDKFYDLLEDGSELGVNLRYHCHGDAEGIAYAINEALDLVEPDHFVVHLGDNIFTDGEDIRYALKNHLPLHDLIFVKEMLSKEYARYGVVHQNMSSLETFIEEKPDTIPFNHHVHGAVLGLYVFYKKHYREAYDNIEPSSRGEYEITDILQYIQGNYDNRLLLHEYTDDWIDCGTVSDIFKASAWRRSVYRNEVRDMGVQ